MDRSFLIGLARDWGIALVAALLLIGGWVWFFGGGPASGDAPALRAQTLNGETFDLHEGEPGPILINFWATWCGPCRSEIPALSAYADDAEVPLLGVSVDEQTSLAQLERFKKRNDMRYEVVWDQTGAASRAWGVGTLPTTFAVSQDGHIVDHRVGTVTTATLKTMAKRAVEHGH